MDKGVIFRKLVLSSARISDPQETLVAQSVYDSAWRRVNGCDNDSDLTSVYSDLTSVDSDLTSMDSDLTSERFDKDSTENFDEKIKSLLVEFEGVVKLFLESWKNLDDFQNRFHDSQEFSIVIVSLLKEIAEKIQNNKFDKDVYRLCGHATAIIGGLLLLFGGAPIVVGAVIFGAGNLVVVGSTASENLELRKNLKEVEDCIKKYEKKLSELTSWFSTQEKLEEKMKSLVASDAWDKMIEGVQNLQEKVVNQPEMTSDEFRGQFAELLENCMSKMAEDGRLVEDYGKELAPAVMTFIFVVCLMNDHNRITLKCSLTTRNIFNMTSGVAALIFQFFSNLGFVVNIIGALLSLYDLCKQPESKHVKEIKDLADKIEETSALLEKVYNETKKYKSHDSVTEWATVAVSLVPGDAEFADLRMAVKQHLPEEAKGRIKILKLQDGENLWLVKVPAVHLHTLPQQIQIKEANCVITDIRKRL